MAKRDYYEILGVPRNATGDDIKKVYRSLAMKYHPDRNMDKTDAEKAEVEAKFKEMNEANDCLSDVAKRDEYDRYGHQEPGRKQSSGFGPGFAEHFRRHFHQQQQRQQKPENRPCVEHIEITLEEADAGCEKRIKYRRAVGCKTCDMTGSKSKSPEQCKACNGMGQVAREPMPGFRIAEPCNACQGKGTRVTDPCDDCHGYGAIDDYATGDIRIPAGMNEHVMIRSSGRGHQYDLSQPPGDLIIQCHILPHERFQRMGDDLACEIEIDVVTAILGGQARLEVLNGDVLELNIEAGTNPGKQLRLKGQGMRLLNSHEKGNLYAVAKLKFPSDLTQEQKELLTKFKELEAAKA